MLVIDLLLILGNSLFTKKVLNKIPFLEHESVQRTSSILRSYLLLSTWWNSYVFVTDTLNVIFSQNTYLTQPWTSSLDEQKKCCQHCPMKRVLIIISCPN